MAGAKGLHLSELGNPNGAPILALHGFLGCGDDWASIAEALPGYRYICPDLPGHGVSALSGGLRACDMEQTAARLLAELDRLGIETTSLLGYSMGGRLALYTALRYGDRFDRVALESASPGLSSVEERDRRVVQDRALAARLAETPIDEFLREWYAQPLFASLADEPDRLEALIQSKQGSDREGLADSLRFMGTGAQPSLWGELGNLRVPTLLVAGSKDAKFCEIARQMMTRCSVAEWSVAEGAGHNVHHEKPEEFASRLERFLEA